ncbi:hypothetical protein [Nesterenkonia populi]|uniref:hypothetical protein n=1 Tax=Nesterenkonia populi TaxID=1591087 RepID=UPI0011BD6D84|nr:hypothetical protein [Nesterenkonia populi]
MGLFEALTDLPIHSSALIALTAVLFVTALVMRAKQAAASPEPQRQGPSARRARAARRVVEQRRKRLTDVVHAQRNEMSTTENTGPAAEPSPSAPAPRSAAASPSGAQAGGFRIYWGRTILALALLAGLLGGLVTAGMAGFGAVSWTLPALGGAVVLVSLAGLQVTAAVRRRASRRARVQRAFDAAMDPVTDPQLEQRRRQAQQSAQQAGVAQEKQAPFNLREGEQQAAEAAAEQKQEPVPAYTPAQPGQAWEPREVPKPKYVVAEKAERTTPEPLAKPAEPEPKADTKLKSGAAAPAPRTTSADAAPREDAPAPAQPSMDLDKVLARRRA